MVALTKGGVERKIEVVGTWGVGFSNVVLTKCGVGTIVAFTKGGVGLKVRVIVEVTDT